MLPRCTVAFALNEHFHQRSPVRASHLPLLGNILWDIQAAIFFGLADPTKAGVQGRQLFFGQLHNDIHTRMHLNMLRELIPCACVANLPSLDRARRELGGVLVDDVGESFLGSRLARAPAAGVAGSSASAIFSKAFNMRACMWNS